MKPKNGFIIISALALSLASQSHAEKSFAELAAKPDNVAKKVWFGPPPGQLKKLSNIGLPKRIGLIAFNIYDPGSFEYNAMAATYGGTYFRQHGLVDQSANVFSSKFSELGVPVIKEQFAQHGMTVLTPLEFIDSKEKLNAYFDYDLPKGGLQKFAERTMDWVNKGHDVTGAADGFRMIPVHASFLNKPVMESLDNLRQALELDAIMAVTNVTVTNGKESIFSSAIMHLIGPNPEPRPEKAAMLKYWWPMVVYPCGTFGKGFKGLPFHSWKKNETNYQGYEVIVEALSKRTCEELQKHLSKGK